MRFLVCEHCKNIVSLVRDCGVPIYCCGEKMKEMENGVSGASKEKHVPVYEKENGKVSVSVGEISHPMTENHFIEWICLETDKAIQFKKLKPNMPPKAEFLIFEDEEIRKIYSFCNEHSLFNS